MYTSLRKIDDIQWNLQIMDTLGPGILSFIERLSSSEVKECVLLGGFFYCVLYSECPLLEVLMSFLNLFLIMYVRLCCC